MAFESITLANEAIHNPAEPRHFMRFKPVSNRIVVRVGGQILADSVRAMRMNEVGRDLYDSVTYLPMADVSDQLKPLPDKKTHCPLKGDAHYYTLDGNTPIAWSYDEPFDFSAAIKGYVAFYGDQVTLEETGTRA
ncbi:MAG: DUF427 domain-containing protein [Burkholderiaceae bacterium]